MQPRGPPERFCCDSWGLYPTSNITRGNMELDRIKRMNCGCSLSDGVIRMCLMHDAAPKLLKAAEQLIAAHEEAHAEADRDPDDNEYMLSSGMVHAIWNIEDVLNGEEVSYIMTEDGFKKVQGKNRIRQAKLS